MSVELVRRAAQLKHFRLLASDRISRDEARAALRRESSAEGP